MEDNGMQAFGEHLERAAQPLRRAGGLMLAQAERLSDFQFGLLRAYTHFTLSRWREALEVRDPQSLQEYLLKQAHANRELGQQVSEETRRFVNAGQELASEASRLARENAEEISAAARAAAAEAERAADETARAGERRRAQ